MANSTGQNKHVKLLWVCFTAFFFFFLKFYNNHTQVIHLLIRESEIWVRKDIFVRMSVWDG